MQGERGLAHPGGTVDGRDPGRRPVGRRGEQGIQPVQVLGAADEPGWVGRQLRRDGAGSRRYRTGRDDRFAAQDSPVHILELRAWIDTELIGQPVPHVGVQLQCLGAATGRVQGPHERGGDGLVERIPVGQPAEQHDGGTGIGAEQDPGTTERCLDVLARPRLPDPVRPFAGQVGKRLTRHQVQRLAQQLRPPVLRAPGIAGTGDQHAEPAQVDLVGGHVEQVATGPADQRGRPAGVGVRLVEYLADVCEVDAQRRRCTSGGVRPPHPVDQRADRYRPAGLGGEHRDDMALAWSAQLDRTGGGVQLDRTEQTELHRCSSTMGGVNGSGACGATERSTGVSLRTGDDTPG